MVHLWFWGLVQGWSTGTGGDRVSQGVSVSEVSLSMCAMHVATCEHELVLATMSLVSKRQCRKTMGHRRVTGVQTWRFLPRFRVAGSHPHLHRGLRVEGDRVTVHTHSVISLRSVARAVVADDPRLCTRGHVRKLGPCQPRHVQCGEHQDGHARRAGHITHVHCDCSPTSPAQGIIGSLEASSVVRIYRATVQYRALTHGMAGGTDI